MLRSQILPAGSVQWKLVADLAAGVKPEIDPRAVFSDTFPDRRVDSGSAPVRRRHARGAACAGQATGVGEGRRR